MKPIIRSGLFSIIASTLVWAVPIAYAGPQIAARPAAEAIVFEHDGRDTAGYVLYAKRDRGREVRIDLGRLTPDSSGTVRASLPALPQGTYQLAVAAYNIAGESSRIYVSPARVTLGGRSPSTSAGRSADPVPQAPAPPRPHRDDAGSKPRAGIFGRLWKVVAGSPDATDKARNR
jgi:hypothetical protein